MLSLILAAALSAPCPALPGAESLLSRAGLEEVIFEGPPGTQESPTAFGDLVCIAAQDDRPLTVLLDYPADEQGEFQLYLASDGSERAQQRFLAQRRWSQVAQDGRADIGTFRLIERLRRLIAEGRPVMVGPLQQGRTAKFDRNLTLALAPEAPARAAETASASPMRVRLRIVAAGGRAWNCVGGCGLKALPAGPAGRRGVELAPAQGYAGALSLGLVATPALPAARYAERVRIDRAGAWNLFDDLFP